MASGGRTAIFVNEGAGSARSDRVRVAVTLARHALDADLHVTNTRDVDELAAWLRTHLDGYTTAVIAGGDGSLGVAFTVAAGREDLALGYLPAGFGNATRHLLRMPDRPEAQVEVLLRAEARPVDLVAIDDRLALFAGAGWDALVAGRYADAGARRLPGWLAAVTRSIPDLWHQPRVEVRADGWVVHRGPIELLVVGTTPFYGRGLRVNPGARPDGGTLAVRVYRGPAARLAAEAARWAFRLTPDAERIDASAVELRALDDDEVPVQADGDLIGARPEWRFEVRRKAVRLIGHWV